MFDLKPTGQFRKDLKLCKKRGYDLTDIETVLEFLHQDGQVPDKYQPHKLVGKDYDSSSIRLHSVCV